MDTNSIDAFIQTSVDGFTQIYNTVSPPAGQLPPGYPQPVTPLVYSVSTPAGAAVGIDSSTLIVLLALAVGIWWLSR